LSGQPIRRYLHDDSIAKVCNDIHTRSDLKRHRAGRSGRDVGTGHDRKDRR
jgi:hypothetical protein